MKILILLFVFTSLLQARVRSCFEIYPVVALQGTEGQQLRENVASKEAREYGIPVNDPRYPLRSTLVATMKTPERRRALREGSLADMRTESRALNRRLEAVQKKSKDDPRFIDEASQVYDVISIGAGVHDTIFNLEVGKSRPDLKVLTVEASEDVAGVFSKDGFYMNSPTGTSRVEETPIPKQGRNLNYLPGGVVQVSDYATRKYNTALEFADSVLQNRRAVQNFPGREKGSAPLLFGREVKKVEDQFLSTEPGYDKWPRRYRITLDNGVQIYASAIANNTGIGKNPRLDRFDRESQVVINRERNRRDGNTPPKIQISEDYFGELYENPEAFRAYKNETVAVIGPGNSSDTAIESLLGFGPSESYGNVGGSAGRVKKIFWFGQDKTTCDAFLNSTRLRYSDIASGLKNDTITAFKDGATSVEKLPDGRFKVSDGQGNSQIVDRIILGTGFEENVADLYEPITNSKRKGDSFNSDNLFRESGYVEPIRGTIPEKGKVDVAKRLVNPRDSRSIPEQQIYFFGPSAGKLADKSELAGVVQNFVSIFLSGPRTKEGTRNLISNLDKSSIARIPVQEQVPLEVATDRTENFLTPVFKAEEGARPRFKPSDSLVRTRVIQWLSGFKLPDGKTEIRITRLPNNEFVVTTVPPLKDSGVLKLGNKIQEDPSLVSTFAAIIGEGQKARELVIQIDGKGRVNLLNPDQLLISTTNTAKAKLEPGSYTEAETPRVKLEDKVSKTSNSNSIPLEAIVETEIAPDKADATKDRVNALQATLGNQYFVSVNPQTSKIQIARASRSVFPQGTVQIPVAKVDILLKEDGTLKNLTAENCLKLITAKGPEGKAADEATYFRIFSQEASKLNEEEFFYLVRQAEINKLGASEQIELLNQLDNKITSPKKRAEVLKWLQGRDLREKNRGRGSIVLEQYNEVIGRMLALLKSEQQAAKTQTVATESTVQFSSEPFKINKQKNEVVQNLASIGGENNATSEVSGKQRQDIINFLTLLKNSTVAEAVDISAVYARFPKSTREAVQRILTEDIDSPLVSPDNLNNYIEKLETAKANPELKFNLTIAQADREIAQDASFGLRSNSQAEPDTIIRNFWFRNRNLELTPYRESLFLNSLERISALGTPANKFDSATRKDLVQLLNKLQPLSPRSIDVLNRFKESNLGKDINDFIEELLRLTPRTGSSAIKISDSQQAIGPEIQLLDLGSSIYRENNLKQQFVRDVRFIFTSTTPLPNAEREKQEKIALNFLNVLSNSNSAEIGDISKDFMSIDASRKDALWKTLENIKSNTPLLSNQRLEDISRKFASLRRSDSINIAKELENLAANRQANANPAPRRAPLPLESVLPRGAKISDEPFGIKQDKYDILRNANILALRSPVERPAAEVQMERDAAENFIRLLLNSSTKDLEKIANNVEFNLRSPEIEGTLKRILLVESDSPQLDSKQLFDLEVAMRQAPESAKLGSLIKFIRDIRDKRESDERAIDDVVRENPVFISNVLKDLLARKDSPRGKQLILRALQSIYGVSIPALEKDLIECAKALEFYDGADVRLALLKLENDARIFNYTNIISEVNAIQGRRGARGN